MSKINDGGPAYPIPIAGCTDGSIYNTLEQSRGELGGMSLRDYFAAKAMAQLMSGHSDSYTVAECAAMLGIPIHQYSSAKHWPMIVARLAYEQADSMLSARNGGSDV